MKFKVPISSGPRVDGDSHRWGGAAVPVLAVCLMIAPTSPSGALPLNGTDYVQQTVPSITQTAGATEDELAAEPSAPSTVVESFEHRRSR